VLGLRTWIAGLALVVGASVIVICVWMNHPKEQHLSERTDKVVPTQQEASRGAKPEPAPAATSVATYQNARFAYVVDYPSPLLKAGQEADNGDGLRFVPNTGDADVRVWGQYNANDDSPTAILQFDLANDCAGDKVSYQVSKPNLIAFSCLSPRGRVVYTKIVISGDTLATLRFEYDPGEQETWSPVIKQMANSLRLGADPAH
jgi:hypothetical protein